VITGQLHTSSLERIRGTAAGLAAMDGKDPKGGGGGDHHNNNRYKIMYANNNKKGKGRGYHRFIPPEKSRCAIFKQPGHWKNKCPDKDELDNAEAKETGAKGVSFGNLKNGGDT
jgi:hypothetical protein